MTRDIAGGDVQGISDALSQRLSGRVAIVTGASRGIGKATAERLSREGARVLVSGRDDGALRRVCEGIAASGGVAVACTGDITVADDRRRIVDLAEAELGPVDILVNNGAINKVEPSLDVTMQTWSKVLNTNLTAAFFLSQLVATGMLKRGSGRIINVASDAGFRGYPEHAAYGTSKAGLIQLTRVLANEWGPYGLRVNAIAPGATWTGMTEPAMGIPEVRAAILARGVLDRISTPQDIAAGIAFLASDDSDMITGHVLSVDGGSVAR